MTERIFRKLTLDDLDMLMDLNNYFRPDFICRTNAQRFLSNPANWIFACIEDRQIIGFVYGYELPRLNASGNMLYLHELAVIERYRRQSIARLLMMGVKELCRLTGIPRIFLFTQKSNTAACALYESEGGESNRKDDTVYFFNRMD